MIIKLTIAILLLLMTDAVDNNEAPQLGQSTPFMPCAAFDTEPITRTGNQQCVERNYTCSGNQTQNFCSEGSGPYVTICECGYNEFKCHNKTCLDIVKRCDQVKDCESGEDEENCESFTCPIPYFQCKSSHACIHADQCCDYQKDCPDGSDELDCTPRNCYHLEFNCTNGRCLRPLYICDGDRDCEDGADEMYCSPEDFRTCSSGKKVHRHFWCDFILHCRFNMADEINCGDLIDKSRGDLYECPQKQFIRKHNKCDFKRDCLDGADEIDCSTYKEISGYPLCEVGKSVRLCGRCLAKEFICDNIVQCEENETTDEDGCRYNKENCTEGQFTCEEKCIPSSLVCDGLVNCINGEDEQNCEIKECEGQWRCRNQVECIDNSDRCNRRPDCRDWSDEMFCDDFTCKENERKCKSGQCAPKDNWCDHKSDCPDESDESNCSFTDCKEDQFSCTSRGQCIDKSNVCMIYRDRSLGCIDDSHLLNCGNLTCPSDMYKCRSGPCLQKELHGCFDEQIDCPDSWDDRSGCPFVCSSDVSECQCRDRTINCEGLNLRHFPKIDPNINTLHYSDNNLSFALDRPVDYHPTIQTLDLSRNNIMHINNGTFKKLTALRFLLLKDNHIRSLEAYAFEGLHMLSTLDLRGNQIETVGSRAFYGLQSLQSLDLGCQEIISVERLAFETMTFLKYLNLAGNPMTKLDDHIFDDTPNLSVLKVQQWQWCCRLPASLGCTAPNDKFSSCEDLMSNVILRICIWILGITALTGNIAVIVWRMRCHWTIKIASVRRHAFLVINLAIGDMMMGVYLLIVAVADAVYRGDYYVKDEEWRNSVYCKFAGFISTFSSELSVFTMTVITVDRLITTKYSVGPRALRTGFLRRVMLGVWLSVILLAAIPFFSDAYFGNFYGRSGVCLALHITKEKPRGWQYAVFVFMVLNLLSFAVIAAGYILMYRITVKGRAAVQMSVDKRLMKSLTIIVATDAACWLPIIILGMVSLSGGEIKSEVFAWIAVFVLPLNAALNPILYTSFPGAQLRSRFTSLRQSLTSSFARSTTSTSAGNNKPEKAQVSKATGTCARGESAIQYQSRSDKCTFRPPSSRLLNHVQERQSSAEDKDLTMSTSADAEEDSQNEICLQDLEPSKDMQELKDRPTQKHTDV